MAKRTKHLVWRFQRSTAQTAVQGDIVTAMTHDRRWAVHFALTESWEMNFHGRHTFYAEAALAGAVGKPRLMVIREVTQEEWK